MKTAQAIVEILKREGVEFVIGYPVNPILEFAARADVRPIIVRQERTGLHMADAVSRVTSGRRIGVFAMQHGPGSENAAGGEVANVMRRAFTQVRNGRPGPVLVEVPMDVFGEDAPEPLAYHPSTRH